VFLFAVFAALASVLTELVTGFVGLRGQYVLRGHPTLVDGPAASSWACVTSSDVGRRS